MPERASFPPRHTSPILGSTWVGGLVFMAEGSALRVRDFREGADKQMRASNQQS